MLQPFIDDKSRKNFDLVRDHLKEWDAQANERYILLLLLKHYVHTVTLYVSFCLSQCDQDFGGIPSKIKATVEVFQYDYEPEPR